MGWKGKGLGKQEQGITEPIKSGIRDRRLGLGKQEEDDYFTAEENIQRGSLILRSRRLRKSLRDGRSFTHLSSYDHNHKKIFRRLKTSSVGIMQRFKEMKEMHCASSRDDRKKPQQQRQERVMTKIRCNRTSKKKKNVLASSPAKTTIAPLAVQEERKTLKLGFSSKSSSMSKSQPTSSNRKPKVTISSIFCNDSDED